jgi:hypothetical protein
MKKGLLTLIVLGMTGLSFIATGALIAADIPDEIIIKGDSYKKDTKGPVKFSHKKHSTEYKAACDECHHDYKDGKNVWTAMDPVKKCSECHDYEESKGEMKKRQTAFHNNCKTCHKQAKKGGKEAPDTKCDDCHQKE